MDKIRTILNNLRKGIPQSVARFNDGEIQAIIQPGCTVARGDQNVNQELSDKLREAIQHKQENYWVGIPCDQCATAKWHKHAIKLVDPDYKYLTKAVVTTNRNWNLFIEQFPKVTIGKRIVWMGGNDQKMDKLIEMGIKPTVNIINKPQDAWSQYESFKDNWKTFQKGDIIVMSCGPLSRVLAYHWFKKRNDCTYLDVGSAFDPFTRGVWHSCHKGTLAQCKGCN